jgi:hypothetical protein
VKLKDSCCVISQVMWQSRKVGISETRDLATGWVGKKHQNASLLSHCQPMQALNSLLHGVTAQCSRSIRHSVPVC